MVHSELRTRRVQVHDMRMASLSVRLKHIGLLIKQDRDGRGWSQADLAKRAGVSVRTVSKTENGGAVYEIKLRAICETGLGWPIGRMDVLLAGDTDAIDSIPGGAAPHDADETPATDMGSAEFDVFLKRTIELLPRMRERWGDAFADDVTRRLIGEARERDPQLATYLQRIL